MVKWVLSVDLALLRETSSGHQLFAVSDRVASLYLSPSVHLLLLSTFSGEPGSAVERLERPSEAAYRGGEGADSEACRGPGG